MLLSQTFNDIILKETLQHSSLHNASELEKILKRKKKVWQGKAVRRKLLLMSNQAFNYCNLVDFTKTCVTD